jgi:hypothetical protein
MNVYSDAATPFADAARRHRKSTRDGGARFALLQALMRR